MGGAGGQAGAQDGIFVAAAGGGVDREAEGLRRAAVAQPAQRDGLAAGQDPDHVCEGTTLPLHACADLIVAAYRSCAQTQQLDA